ncbi:unnamed protein product [Penicillium nalgiovense]|nr:unnamed protein product [Penicillium nalgiovense]
MHTRERQPRVRHEEAPRIFLASHPIFTPRASSAKTRHLLHAMQQLEVSECRSMTGALESTDQSLPGEMKRRHWVTARRVNDSIGYTIQMPHTLRSDPSGYVAYRRKFIRRAAADSSITKSCDLMSVHIRFFGVHPDCFILVLSQNSPYPCRYIYIILPSSTACWVSTAEL